MKKIYTTLLLSSLLLFASCDSYLDIKPVGSVIPTTAKEYRSLLARAYKLAPRDRTSIGFRSDEMQVNDDNNDQRSYGDWERWNDYTPSPNTNQLDWSGYYSAIFIANHVIENQAAITDGSEQEINQLAGEAYLFRAYMHFVLVNLHGQPYTKAGAPATKSIPLQLNNDLEVYLTRNTVEEVYASILSDIDRARQLINKAEWEAVFSYRFTTLAVEAMQSRTSLYMAQWQTAYDAAERVLAQKATLEDLNAAVPVLPNHFRSVENITALEFMPTAVNLSSWPTTSLLSLYEPGDRRQDLYFAAPNATGQRRCRKVGNSEFASTFRVAEMYLNAAEAAAQLNNLPQARTRLLELMQKRYTAEAYDAKRVAVEGMNQTELLKEIIDERARELAYEGHRWFDLRRTNRPRIEKVLKAGTFVLEQDDPRYTILIPKEAIVANPGLRD